MNKKILQLIIVMLFAMSGVMAQTVQLGHVTNAVPGTVTVPLNMNDFTGANGDLGAISLYVQYDSDLLTYTGFSNLNSAFSGINVNYSQPTHELRIIWYGSAAGITINGKLLDLNFTYSGGFSTDMVFTDECEINKFNFNPIAATYENGSVSNSPNINTYTGAVGSWPQTAEVGETISLPILIQGNTDLNPEAYSAVNSITLKIAFDKQKLTYHGVTNNTYGFSVAENNGVLNLQWSSVTPRDFRTFAPLMFLNFTYNGGGIALLEFKPGSMVTSGYFVENTYFINGNIQLHPAAPGTGSLNIAKTCTTENTANIPVTYAGDPIANVGALTLNFNYDNTKLTYAGYTANQLTGWLVSHTAGHLTFINTSATGQTINAGSLVTLKFNYTSGKADIAFEAGTSLLNTGFTYIPLILNDGYVSLTPEITDQPDAQTVNYGAPATFSITATNAISYQWQELVSGVWTDITNGGIYSGATTNTLTISAATGNMNTYQYKCIVQPCDITSDAATLTYNDAVITDQPDPQTVNLGASASFNLTATGFSGFQWQEYNGSTWTPITDGGIYSGATTNTLTISSVVAAMNDYQYKCVVMPGNVECTAALLTVNPLKVAVKAFLQGPYNATTHTMAVTLRTKAYFPLNQPYNVSPWNYAGTESVVSVPINVVDWVLVELRTNTAASTTVAKKACFVKNDGSIVDIYGNELTFPGLDIGNYYIVVRHRNHLAIMSATSQTLSSTSAEYDFTTALNKAYGSNPMLLASDGKALMVGGDVNKNGTARANGPASVNDMTMIINFCGSSTLYIYSPYDVNLDGVARANGPSSVNDVSKISSFLGAVTYTSKVPN